MPTWAQEVVLLENADVTQWREQHFEKIPRHTRYSVVEDAEGAPGGGPVLEARANDSASGFIIERSLDFSDQATLLVSYKVVDGRNDASEKTKAGDDFPLRMYLTAKGLVQYRTLVLVHSLQHDAGEVWTSPYDGNLARFEVYVVGGKDEVGSWVEAQVPVGRIWREVYGDLPGELTGIAFMVDSDNAHGAMHTLISKIAYSP